MTDDIVARLRLYAQKQRETKSSVLGLLLSDAADEIERLRVIVQGWELSERDSTALLAMLSKPDHPNAALRQAAKRHKQITSEGDMLSADGSASRRTPMIEPTEGEIVDVLNNYLNSGSRDTFHQILIGRAIAEIEQLRKERDEAWLEKGRIMNEIDCRIEHGADSNGHLEAIRKLFSKQALEKMTRLDEEMGLL